MAPSTSIQIPNVSQLDVLQNRIAVAIATRDRLVQSWSALSSRKYSPSSTQKELDADDKELSHFAPPHLGLGAPVPKAYLKGDLERREIASSEKLRHLFLGSRPGRHQGSKPRDSQEKTYCIKRKCKDDSSDEDEGRSGLGKAKTFKPSDSKEQPAKDASRIGNTQYSGSGLSISNHTEANLSLSAPSSQNATKEHIIVKKPLVDYSSDDDCGGDLPAVVTAAPTKSITQPMPLLASNLEPNVVQSRNVNDQTKAVTVKPSSNTFSRNVSPKETSRTSCSDSEPSDLETVIPISLNADVKKLDSFAADDAKRGRNRQTKGTKKMEKLSRQRAPKLAGGNVGIPMGALVGGPVIAKKLKDKLLDAHGN